MNKIDLKRTYSRVMHPRLLSKHTILLLIGLITAMSACNRSEQNNANSGGNTENVDSETIPAVEAVEARYGSLPLRERIHGTVEAFNQVQLYPEINARIQKVMVRTGERVQKNEPLVQLRDQPYREQLQQAKASLEIQRARLNQAKARLQELQAHYKRTKPLTEKQLSSELELETLEARIQSARADVQMAEAQVQEAQSNIEEQKEMLSRTVIRAPIDGTIGQRNAEVGMLANPGTRLFTLGNLDSVRVEIPLTEQMLYNVRVGQTAIVHARSETDSSETIEAEISRISPYLNREARSTEAEIDIDNSKGILKPGMFVPVDVLYGESRQATLVPISAVWTEPETGQQGIYVVGSLSQELQSLVDTTGNNEMSMASLTRPLQVDFQPVQVIAEGRMQAGVNGLDPGTWVVTIGQHLLSQGYTEARVKTTGWNRIMKLQQLQTRDLLMQTLQQQRRQLQSSQSDTTNSTS